MNPEKLIITKYNDCVISVKFGSDLKVERITCDNPLKESITGNIYAVNITMVRQDLGGAFVEYAPGKSGFLEVKNNAEIVFLNKMRTPGPLRGGDCILAQCTKDSTGVKDPCFSNEVTLSGKYVVLTANSPGVKISSKIKGAKRKQLSEMFSQLENGFIIRTEAADAAEDLIRDDINCQNEKWKEILAAAVGKSRVCILKNPGEYQKAAIESECEIVTDERKIFNELKDVIHDDRLRLYEDRRLDMKKVYSIDKVISDAVSKKVWLKSGGFLVIEPTEALVSVDVNSGKMEAGKNSEATYFKTDIEAAEEIARQLRIRNLSGMIIVDFINLKNEEQRKELIKKLKGELAKDEQKAIFVDMTGLGLVEITRKKTTRPLYELLYI